MLLERVQLVLGTWYKGAANTLYVQDSRPIIFQHKDFLSRRTLSPSISLWNIKSKDKSIASWTVRRGGLEDLATFCHDSSKPGSNARSRCSLRTMNFELAITELMSVTSHIYIWRKEVFQVGNHWEGLLGLAICPSLPCPLKCVLVVHFGPVRSKARVTFGRPAAPKLLSDSA